MAHETTNPGTSSAVWRERGEGKIKNRLDHHDAGRLIGPKLEPVLAAVVWERSTGCTGVAWETFRLSCDPASEHLCGRGRVSDQACQLRRVSRQRAARALVVRRARFPSSLASGRSRFAGKA